MSLDKLIYFASVLTKAGHDVMVCFVCFPLG